MDGHDNAKGDKDKDNSTIFDVLGLQRGATGYNDPMVMY